MTSLPHLNAALNATSALALALGYVFIRRRRVAAHLTCMLTALCVSALFLTSYLVYHLQVGSVRFQGDGWLRVLYLGILISHIALAVTVLPLAAITLYRAGTGQFHRHRALAHWTLPVWFYVSITGVAVYLMLYRLG
ncbi:MAG: DUF420 domain-containing protein [Gemmatimonadetes bacterium]|nr:DUF420 domain-containing protein [Gemmatimonadota bacterium]